MHAVTPLAGVKKKKKAREPAAASQHISSQINSV